MNDFEREVIERYCYSSEEITPKLKFLLKMLDAVANVNYNFNTKDSTALNKYIREEEDPLLLDALKAVKEFLVMKQSLRKKKTAS